MSDWEKVGKSDDWYTPKYIFDFLNCKFDMDVAAPVDRTFCNVPAEKFITENSLNETWNGFVWMNAPFGKRNGLEPWLDKIYAHRNGIALTPDRTSAPWWQKAARQCDGILFIAGKVKFVKPNGTTGDSPSTGTTLLAYGYSAFKALQDAERKGLGLMVKRTASSKL